MMANGSMYGLVKSSTLVADWQLSKDVFKKQYFNIVKYTHRRGHMNNLEGRLLRTLNAVMERKP